MLQDTLWQRPRAALAEALAPAAALAGALAPRQPAGGRLVACRPTYLPPLAWIAMQAAALWPHGLWIARRAQDGSDDPLGLVALAVFGALLLHGAMRLRVAPHTGWLALAAALTVAAQLLRFVLPPLAAAVLAASALAAGVAAWTPTGRPRAALAGLLLLALPLVASLQYYAGYPLRVLTAQASAWALQANGIDAARSGASMLVQGRLVIVDAPCSGVQMAWMAYFCACTTAAVFSLRDARFLRRLPLVGLLVLAGNVLRNSVLVALEARPQGLAPVLHEGIGVAVLALVCAGVVALVHGGRDARLV
jgi:exosortase/archaeosortase family protein